MLLRQLARFVFALQSVMILISGLYGGVEFDGLGYKRFAVASLIWLSALPSLAAVRILSANPPRFTLLSYALFAVISILSSNLVVGTLTLMKEDAFARPLVVAVALPFLSAVIVSVLIVLRPLLAVVVGSGSSSRAQEL